MIPSKKRAADVDRVVRRQIATHVMNGMLASATYANKMLINSEQWAQKSYELADALIAEGRKK